MSYKLWLLIRWPSTQALHTSFRLTAHPPLFKYLLICVCYRTDNFGGRRKHPTSSSSSDFEQLTHYYNYNHIKAASPHGFFPLAFFRSSSALLPHHSGRDRGTPSLRP